MEKIFVYYHLDYDDEGIEEFDNIEKAAKWIEEAQEKADPLWNPISKVIIGKELKLKEKMVKHVYLEVK